MSRKLKYNSCTVELPKLNTHNGQYRRWMVEDENHLTPISENSTALDFETTENERNRSEDATCFREINEESSPLTLDLKGLNLNFDAINSESFPYEISSQKESFCHKLSKIELVFSIRSHTYKYSFEKCISSVVNLKTFDSRKQPSLSSIRVTFPTKKYLLESKERLHCETCARVFARKSSFLRHIYLHINEDNSPKKNAHPLLSCGICSLKFSQKCQLKIHMKTHTKTTFSNSVPSSAIRDKTNLKNGENICSKQKSFKCHLCSMVFTHSRFLKSHQCQNTEISVTEKSSNLKTRSSRHVATNRTRKKFNCEHCDATFSRKYNLVVHRRLHSGEKPFFCTTCGESFRLKSSLMSHVRIHTGEKPFQCSLCMSSFRIKDHLSTHFRIHSGEKPFRCPYCSSSFAQKNHLNTHINVHTDNRPFRCATCSKKFLTKSKLKLHINTHTGTKPFQCYHCNATFGRKSYLKRHIVKHAINDFAT